MSDEYVVLKNERMVLPTRFLLSFFRVRIQDILRQSGWAPLKDAV
jgi:hypothetical protein